MTTPKGNQSQHFLLLHCSKADVANLCQSFNGQIFQKKLLIMHSIQNPFENLLKFVHAFNSHTLDRTDMSDRPLKG